MRQMSLSIKFFAGSQVASTKKWMKKADSVSYLQKKNTRNCGQPRPSNTKKTLKVRDHLTVQISEVSRKSCKISNMTVEILRIYELYVTTTTFTLMLQNGLLVLVAPSFRNR